VPPVAAGVITLVPPLQLMAVDVAVAITAVGCVIFIVVLFLQPLASVASTVYIPDGYVAATAVAFMVNEYGAVPPVAAGVITLVPPLQLIAVDVALAIIAVGSVIFIVVLFLQPLASVASMVYIPDGYVAATAVVFMVNA
jgi:hypothetical protein